MLANRNTEATDPNTISLRIPSDMTHHPFAIQDSATLAIAQVSLR